MLSAHTAGCFQAPFLCLLTNLSSSLQSVTWIQQGLCSPGFPSPCHCLESSCRRKLTLCASFFSRTTPYISVVKLLKAVALNILCSAINFYSGRVNLFSTLCVYYLFIHYYFMVRTLYLCASYFLF